MVIDFEFHPSGRRLHSTTKTGRLDRQYRKYIEDAIEQEYGLHNVKVKEATDHSPSNDRAAKLHSHYERADYYLLAPPQRNINNRSYERPLHRYCVTFEDARGNKYGILTDPTHYNFIKKESYKNSSLFHYEYSSKQKLAVDPDDFIESLVDIIKDWLEDNEYKLEAKHLKVEPAEPALKTEYDLPTPVKVEWE